MRYIVGVDDVRRAGPEDRLELPSLGADDEGDGLEGWDALTDAVELEGEPSFDDEVASDLPLDIELDIAVGETSALDDDAEGLTTGDVELSLHVTGPSFLDTGGSAEEGLDRIGDEALGLDPIPSERDDGGLEGLEDPTGEEVDETDFPPLDGERADDTQPVDVGLADLPPLPELDAPDA